MDDAQNYFPKLLSFDTSLTVLSHKSYTNKCHWTAQYVYGKGWELYIEKRVHINEFWQSHVCACMCSVSVSAGWGKGAERQTASKAIQNYVRIKYTIEIKSKTLCNGILIQLCF